MHSFRWCDDVRQNTAPHYRIQRRQRESETAFFRQSPFMSRPSVRPTVHPSVHPSVVAAAVAAVAAAGTISRVRTMNTFMCGKHALVLAPGVTGWM